MGGLETVEKPFKQGVELTVLISKKILLRTMSKKIKTDARNEPFIGHHGVLNSI